MNDSGRQQRDSWFNRNPKKTIFLFIFLIFGVLFFISELFLRLRGERAGLELPSANYVGRYEDLKVDNPFFTDEEGVFKANKNYKWEDGKYGKGVKINFDGFRSIEFIRDVSNHKKILFLGDSFTWGASAKPIKNCFVDLVSLEGYLVFNTGIGGTGPNQYAFLAEKYVPLLRPDIVAVMFYMGNDIYETPYPMLPSHNLFHITNAGWIYGYDDKGKALSVKEAFFYYYYPNYSLEIFKNKVKYFFMSTVIGKKFWLFINAMKHSASANERRSMSKNVTDSLRKIKSLSEKYGAKFMLFIIPVSPKVETSMNRVKDNISILAEFKPIIPEFLKNEDYTEPPDSHFNNSGHGKYAKFIIRVMRQELD